MMLGVCRRGRSGARLYHTHRVTDNIHFLTNHNDKITIDPTTFRITRRVEKPICVQMNWLAAPEPPTRRYSRLLLAEGLDVLTVRCDVRHVLLPTSGAQRIAADLLQLMSSTAGSYLLFGLSIGSYVWAEAMVRARTHQQYRPVLDRVAAQIWDSIAYMNHVPTGISLALFPNFTDRQQKWVSFMLDRWYSMYLKSCYTSATRLFNEAERTLLHTPCRAPALVMHATDDAVVPVDYVKNIHDTWIQSGIESTWHSWERSSHVTNYQHHPQQYEALVRAHIRRHLPGLTCADD